MISKQELELAAAEQLVVRYTPRNTDYRVIGKAHIKLQNGDIVTGLAYVGADKVTYVRPSNMFKDFDMIGKNKLPELDILETERYASELTMGVVKIKEQGGEWVDGVAAWQDDHAVLRAVPLYKLPQFGVSPIK